MDSVDFFDSIDIVEVSKKTLIDRKNLTYLKDEEFDKLDKAKGLGFISIIEREYRVDLSGKKERFLEYLKEHGKDKKNEFFIPPPKPPKRVLSKIVVATFLAVIGIGVAYIVYANVGNFASLKQTNEDKNEIVQEAKDISGIDINQSDTQEMAYVQDNATKESEPAQQTIIDNANNGMDTNDSVVLKNDNSTQDDTTAIVEDVNKTDSVISDINQTDKREKASDMVKTVTIVPKSRIWVGVVDLKTYKKKSYIKDTNITIENMDNFMIATGHGRFKIVYKDKTLEFETKNPVRLLFRDGNMTQIDKKKFIELNRGRYW